MDSSKSMQNALFTPFVVRISNLPYNSEPPFIWRIFDRSDAIKEIVMHNGAYVFFDFEEEAKQAVHHHDGTRCGPSHINTELSLEVVLPSEVPTGKTNIMTLSEFRRAGKTAVKTKTVRFSKIRNKNPTANVREMCEQVLEYGLEDEPHAWYEYIHPEPGPYESEALVRFTSIEAANCMVDWFNGDYWKNATIYLTFVPDEELNDIIKHKDEAKKSPTVKIFIPAVKPGTHASDLYEVFKPYKLKDVNVAPSGKVAFLFMSLSEATALLQKYPKCKYFNGWRYNLRFDKMDQEKLPSVIPTPAAAQKNEVGEMASLAVQASTLSIGDSKPDRYPTAPAEDVQEVRVANLAYTATEEKVRDFFKGFEISKVTINNGVAIVGLASTEDAERAVLQLNRKKLMKKQVLVQLTASAP